MFLSFAFCILNFKLLIGVVAQLVRAPPCHGGGRGSESRPSRQNHVSYRLQLEGEYSILFIIFNNKSLPGKEEEQW
jgi:hypothetical protein